MKTKLLLLSFSIFIIASCTSIKKQISRGKYDEAIHLAVSKLKKKKSPKYVLALENSFKQANEKDLYQISQFRNSHSQDADLQIVRLYQKISDRQTLIRPLLPLKDKNGYMADIQLIDVAKEQEKYTDKAADFLYGAAQEKLIKGERGDKFAARDAYEDLIELENLAGSTSSTSKLIEKAKKLGTVYILVQAKINPAISLSQQATKEFTSIELLGSNPKWQVIHNTPQALQNYDLNINLNFDNFLASPEKESTREYDDKKEIEESASATSRDQKITTVKKTVTAHVIEVYQFKELAVRGSFVVNDLNNTKSILKDEISTKKVFENYASTFKGDKRALSDISARRVGGRPLPFPSNEAMLNDAIVLLKQSFNDKIKPILLKY